MGKDMKEEEETDQEEERKRKQENTKTQIEEGDGDKGWFILAVRGWRNQSESKRWPNLPTAGRGVLHSSTLARQRGDVSDKINGQKTQRKRESATVTRCWNPPLRGLASYATRILSKHAGTGRSRSGTIKRRRTVNLTR